MAALSSTRRRMQHLLRRAGFGYSASELEEYVALGLAGAVERLLAPEAVDDSAADAAVAALGVDLEERRAGLWQAWHVRLEQLAGVVLVRGLARVRAVVEPAHHRGVARDGQQQVAEGAERVASQGLVLELHQLRPRPTLWIAVAKWPCQK